MTERPRFPVGCGGNPPTRAANEVRRAGSPRVPYFAVARVEVHPEYGWQTRILTCGHQPGSNKANAAGRFPCYECRHIKALAILAGNPDPESDD